MGKGRQKNKVLIKKHLLLLATFELGKLLFELLTSESVQWVHRITIRCFDHQGYTHIWGTTQTVTCSLCVKWITLLNGLRLQCSCKWCLFQALLSLVFIFCFNYITVHTSKPKYARLQVCGKLHNWLTTMWKWCWLHHSVLLSLHIDCL